MTSLVVGLVDSFAVWRTWPMLQQDARIRGWLLQCCLLNCIFLGGNLIFEHGLTPLYELVMGTLDGYDWWFLSSLFHCVWNWPVYFISLLISGYWYQCIITQIKTQTKINQETMPLPSWLLFRRLMAEEVYRLMIVLILALEINLFDQIPYIGHILSFCYTCWMYSFYCFDYIWCIKRWSLQTKMRYMQERSLYFLGYGAILSCITTYTSKFTGLALYAMLFPLFVVQTFYSHLVPKSKLSFPIFLPIILTISVLFHCTQERS